MLSKADRLAFSLSIIEADQQIKGLQDASAQIQQISDKAQSLDEANTHLYTPINNLVNAYQTELNNIDGNLRTSILEQDIVDSANRILGNYFFPNDVLKTIPALSAKNNVWTVFRPFALAFGVGKNYNQSYTTGPSEQGLISTAQSLIASASAYTDIQNTSGQHCINGTCSLPQYTTMSACTTGGGTWNPTEVIDDYPEVQDLKDDLVAAVNGIVTQATAEAAALLANPDTNIFRQAQNIAAYDYITNVLLPDLNAWLGYQDFNTAHGQTTCSGFNGYNANLLAPTKLHSAQLTALSLVLSNRSTALTGRITQLNMNLGSISQNVDTGEYTGTGFYKMRLDFLNLRINLMAGSLTEKAGADQSLVAQAQIQGNLKDNKAVYMSILPTTKLSASGNGTAFVNLVDASFYSVGDIVYITSDTQEELVRAIKSINGKSIQLNDQVPTKYTVLDNTRFYKDIS